MCVCVCVCVCVSVKRRGKVYESHTKTMSSKVNMPLAQSVSNGRLDGDLGM